MLGWSWQAAVRGFRGKFYPSNTFHSRGEAWLHHHHHAPLVGKYLRCRQQQEFCTFSQWLAVSLIRILARVVIGFHLLFVSIFPLLLCVHVCVDVDSAVRVTTAGAAPSCSALLPAAVRPRLVRAGPRRTRAAARRRAPAPARHRHPRQASSPNKLPCVDTMCRYLHLQLHARALQRDA